MQDSFEKIQKVGGVDVSFEKDNIAVVAAVVIDFKTNEMLDEKILKVEMLFPYITGFF